MEALGVHRGASEGESASLLAQVAAAAMGVRRPRREGEKAAAAAVQTQGKNGQPRKLSLSGQRAAPGQKKCHQRMHGVLTHKQTRTHFRCSRWLRERQILPETSAIE